MLAFLWQRITIPELLVDEWFKKDYKPPVFEEKEDTNLDDVEAVFKDSVVSFNHFNYLVFTLKMFMTCNLEFIELV